MTQIVFMGTPEFAVPSLEALTDSYQVAGVVTQPDRRSGRGRRVSASAVKRAALAHELPIFQPQTLRDPDAVGTLTTWQPDVIVVVAFGQILQTEVLALPDYGCLNVHASLLPRWRGATPIAAAILAGDEVTGVTIMKMDAGLDTGPILAQREETIRPDDTQGTLEKRLAKLGADLLLDILPPYLTGSLEPRPQPEQDATYQGRLRKSAGRLDWTQPAVVLARQVRAFDPWPGTFTTLEGKRLKVLDAEPMPHWKGDAPPGTVISCEAGIAVAAGEGALLLKGVQMAGKRPMDIDAFVCGHQMCIGSCLGEETG